MGGQKSSQGCQPRHLTFATAYIYIGLFSSYTFVRWDSYGQLEESDILMGFIVCDSLLPGS